MINTYKHVLVLCRSCVVLDGMHRVTTRRGDMGRIVEIVMVPDSVVTPGRLYLWFDR